MTTPPTAATPQISKGNLPTPYGSWWPYTLGNKARHVIWGKAPDDTAYDQACRDWEAANQNLGGRDRIHNLFGYERAKNSLDVEITTTAGDSPEKTIVVTRRTAERIDIEFFKIAVFKEIILASLITSGKTYIQLYHNSKGSVRLLLINAIVVGLIKGCSKWISAKTVTGEARLAIYKHILTESIAEILTAVIVIIRGANTDQRLKTGLKSAFKHFFENAIEGRMNLDLFWSEMRSCCPEFCKGFFKAFIRELLKSGLKYIVFSLIINTVIASILVGSIAAFIGSVLAVMILNIFVDSCMGCLPDQKEKGD